MRRVMFVALISLAASGCAVVPYTFPSRLLLHRPSQSAVPPEGRWDLVMRLPPSAVIDVLTADGRAHEGRFLRANVQIVWIEVAGASREIPRDDVVRVDLIDLPGSTAGAVVRKGALGAALGAAGMTVLAGIIGGEAWPPPGALVRAGIAGGAYGSGLEELTRRRPRIIYVAPQFRW